ncbi:hypothetical protein DL93DRAFT_2089256 [Clavulina sp. PMI_390]|nr:hypothetical protein DL93DRAFT_2089256 [Clavulina sp. PMI_390]
MVYEIYPWFHGSFALRTGIVLIAETALVSFISVAGLLLVVLIRTIKRWNRQRTGNALPTDEPIQPVAALFLLAMCMELGQAVANIMSIRWAFQSATTEGHYCTAQAVLKQLTNDGAALFTMFLGIMTVLPTIWPAAMLGDGMRRAKRVVWGMVAFVVVFWLFIITIPATTVDHYYGSTGPWCWIPTKLNGHVIPRNEYLGIATEYGWFWLASLTCFGCYGYIVVRWWKEADRDPELIRQAIVMIWYPVAYFVEIFPQSVVRVLNMHAALVGKPPPAAGWTVLTTVLFASSGWVNVLLWVITGRQYGFSAAPDLSDDDEESGVVGRYELKPGADVAGLDASSVDPSHVGVYEPQRGASLERGFLQPEAAHEVNTNPAFPGYVPPSDSGEQHAGGGLGSPDAYRASVYSSTTGTAPSPTGYGAGVYQSPYAAGPGTTNPYDTGAYQPGAYTYHDNGH